jgi:two-component system OmpR family response regulator
VLNKRHKILVVDDERAIVSLRATILESRGYETATAYSGEEAVRVAHSFQPDCIVSDIMMEAMTGVEAAIGILRFLPQCKVLFITGNAGYKNLLGEARAKGFNFEALDKPVTPTEVLARIAMILSDSSGSNRKPATSEYRVAPGLRSKGF